MEGSAATLVGCLGTLTPFRQAELYVGGEEKGVRLSPVPEGQPLILPSLRKQACFPTVTLD